MKTVTLDLAILDKEALYFELKNKLGLPAYCAPNWDSLEACLYDAELSSLRLVNVGESRMSEQDLEIYVAILVRFQQENDSIEIAFATHA